MDTGHEIYTFTDDNYAVILAASSGSGKGPVEEVSFERVKEIQNELYDEYRDELVVGA